MTKPSREEYEDVAYIIDNGGTLTGRGRQVAAAALRIAAEQVGEREKVVAYINALIEALPPIYDGERKILSRVVMNIERGDHSTAKPND